MTTLSSALEDFIKCPQKTLASLRPFSDRLKKVFSLEYDDHPADEKYYEMHRHWLKLLNDYYFKVEHTGAMDAMQEVAAREKVILISNHANTFEAPLLCYYFWMANLGKVRPLVFREVFRLPIIREIFKSGQCLPVSVEAGTQALQDNHVLLFPEGMDFIKHYLKKDYVVRFHKGFLRIAKKYLEESGASHVYLQPVGHDGIDHTVKFWVINHPMLVKHLIQPYLHYPFFVLPKAPIVFPTHAVFRWGRPWRLTLDDLKDERALGRLAEDFRHEILRLRQLARRIRRMDRAPAPVLEALDS